MKEIVRFAILFIRCRHELKQKNVQYVPSGVPTILYLCLYLRIKMCKI